MYNYDLDNSGFINTEDLSRVFKKIGIMHPEPHLETLNAAGGVQEGQDKIDCQLFSSSLNSSSVLALTASVFLL